MIDAKGETSRSAFLALKPFLTDDGPYLLAKGMWRDRDQEIIAEMIPLLLGTSSKSDLILPLSKMTAELGTALALPSAQAPFPTLNGAHHFPLWLISVCP